MYEFAEIRNTKLIEDSHFAVCQFPSQLLFECYLLLAKSIFRLHQYSYQVPF